MRALGRPAFVPRWGARRGALLRLGCAHSWRLGDLYETLFGHIAWDDGQGNGQSAGLF